MSILIDGHIHIHPHVVLDRMLDAAWSNFEGGGNKMFSTVPDSCVLMLAEGGKNNVFAELQDRAAGDGGADMGWQFRCTDEANSVLAVNGSRKIIIIAGRQLISREKLELLSLFCPDLIEDNRFSLAELAGLVTERGGLPLIAWGVGKWLGSRGRVVEEFIDHPPVKTYLVGDNGNRPAFWPYPKLLSRAEGNGVPSLAGSDPLPLAGHAGRAGSYGAGIAGGTLGDQRPADELHRILVSAPVLQPYGRGVGLIRFFRDQVQVNLNKRLGSSGR